MTRDTSALVVYFSRTGNTAALAERVVDRLEGSVADVTVERVRPRRSRSYPNWLLRSAVPGSTVPIEHPEHAPRAFDAVFLGTPKWTLSCPPVTEYVERADLRGTRLGLFLTFGGFDQERYRRSLRDRLREAGAHVPASLPVQRDAVDEAALGDDVARFCRHVARA